MKARNMPVETIDGPAIVTADHVQDRILSAAAGSKLGWSKRTSYERAFNKGHLVCKERCTHASATHAEEARAHDRFAAARALDLGWHSCLPSFPAGSDFDRVRGGGSGTPGAFADHVRDVKAFWRRVQSAMGENDWRICRMACCEGYAVSEAVATVSPAYKFATLVRFREALDALVAAIQQAKLRARQSGQR